MKNNSSFEYWGDASFIPYVGSLKDRARDMRKNMTHAECLFWSSVKNKQFHGLKFLRQKPLLGYIVDFYCAELKLVIEIDGSVHNTSKEYDMNRTNDLQLFGIRIIRYTNNQIEFDIKSVLNHLTDAIKNKP
ncbi:MAG: endonuclease domain-containing protein [Patescibacteria group bacterium]